jgi:hypothetical protein
MSNQKKLRFEIFKRDSFVCQYCGSHPPKAILHVDHIVPVADGGENDEDNLTTSCAACNLGKGARSLKDVWIDAGLDVVHENDEAHQLLEEWAIWAREPMAGDSGGGDGYMREKLDQAHDSAEMTDRIANAEKALARLGQKNRIWLKILKKYYLARKGEAEIASGMRLTEGYTRNLLKEGRFYFWRLYLEIKA